MRILPRTVSTLPILAFLLAAFCTIRANGAPATNALTASIASMCELCSRNFGDTKYRDRDLLRNKEIWLCRNCSLIKDRCDACGRIVGGRSPRRLPDERFYCETDWKGLILEQREAETMFNDVVREMTRMLTGWGTAPDTNITFTLVDKDEFLRQHRRTPSHHNPELIMGLTRSKDSGNGRFEHSIFVLNGLLRERFRAVCAHEFGHAWLAEHEKKKRALHDDTVEGFCELLAWKLMDLNGDPYELDAIESNTYTRGQLAALLAAEKAHRFYRVVDWVLGGIDGWLEREQLDRVLALRDDATTNPAPLAAAAATPPPGHATIIPELPEKLNLRGVVGTAQSGRIALINDRMVKAGETTKVRLKTGSVMLRCVEIQADAVLVEVVGSGEKQQLRLDSK